MRRTKAGLMAETIAGTIKFWHNKKWIPKFYSVNITRKSQGRPTYQLQKKKKNCAKMAQWRQTGLSQPES
jgi:hypothetical protein